MQAGGFRREIVPRGVRAAHDDRQLIQRRVLETEMADEAVERAEFAFMRERLGARNVVRRRAGLLGDGEDLFGWHVEKSALGSMKRRMNHGQAMRSILGRSRVTHFMSSSLI